MCGFDYVIGVWRNEGTTVLTLEVWVDHQLLSLEIMEIDDCQTRVVLVIDEEVLTVIFTIGLRDRRMVGITEVDIFAIDASLSQNGLGLIIKTIALPWLWCEDTDIFQNTHRGDAVDDYLSALSTRAEGDVFITTTRRGIGFCRCEQIFLCEAAGLHHIIQRRTPR